MISAYISTYKDFLPLRRKAGTASLHGCKIAVAIGSLCSVASRKARMAKAFKKPWMNKGKTEIRRFRRPFGSFWAAPKGTQPVKSVGHQNRHSFNLQYKERKTFLGGITPCSPTKTSASKNSFSTGSPRSIRRLSKTTPNISNGARARAALR